MLTLSGGYERHINNIFSVLAEPYVKIPFEGIGFGKVQLYSAGVLLTLKVNPFKAWEKINRNNFLNYNFCHGGLFLI